MERPSEAAKFLKSAFGFLPSLEPFRSFTVPALVSDSCFNSLFLEFEIMDVACVRDLVSKVAGYGIIFLSIILKIPIIYNIISSGTTEGLAMSSLALECSMYFTNSFYNYFIGSPFSIYGENLVIMMQNVIIMALIVVYERKGPVFVSSLVLFSGLFAFLTFLLPEEYFWMLISWTIICSMISKIPQIYTNFFYGHTGVQSIFTSFLQVAGATVRLFTVLNDNPDKMILVAMSIGLFLNLLILIQIVLFRKKTKQIMELSAAKVAKSE